MPPAARIDKTPSSQMCCDVLRLTLRGSLSCQYSATLTVTAMVKWPGGGAGRGGGGVGGGRRASSPWTLVVFLLLLIVVLVVPWEVRNDQRDGGAWLGCA